MYERFYHFLWLHRLYNSNNLTSTDGQKIEVVHPGKANSDVGPDFIDARIKINGTLWAGCVEIHTDSADWYLHKHHTDKAYNNVILHVVAHYTKEVFDSTNRKIPTLVISPDKNMELTYKDLITAKKWIPCEDIFPQIDSFRKTFWIEALSTERLQQKSAQLAIAFDEVGADYDELFYRLLCRNMGFKVNAQPFEQLARITPLKIIRKISDNPIAIEALLFG